MDINAEIEAAVAASKNAQPNALENTEVVTEEQSSATPPDDSEQEETEARKPLTAEEEVEKLRKALARNERRIGKMTAQKYQANKELEEAKQRLSHYERGGSKTPAPKEIDYQNYADYMEAQTAWRIDQKLEERDAKSQVSQSEQKLAEWRNERTSELLSTADDIERTMPEVAAIVQQNVEILANYSQDLKDLILECDNPALAVLNLAKEGKLESLSSMPLTRAAREIALAEAKKTPTPISKAPTPMTPSRGSGSGSKPLESLSVPELMKKFSK